MEVQFPYFAGEGAKTPPQTVGQADNDQGGLEFLFHLAFGGLVLWSLFAARKSRDLAGKALPDIQRRLVRIEKKLEE